jgi:hypothetical protein
MARKGMKVKQSGAPKKVATQKVPATQLIAASHTRKPGYITSPNNVVAAGAHTYAHRAPRGHGAEPRLRFRRCAALFVGGEVARGAEHPG